MAQNDKIALDSNYKHWLETRGSGLTGVNPFNYYCMQNFLKSFPVDDAEIRAGLVDKSKDGGVDAFYFFANRKYVTESPQLDVDAEYNVNLVIAQMKEGAGFSPTEVQKHFFFTDDLLDIGRPESKYQHEYHSGLKALMRIFKEQYNQIAGSMPQVNIDYYYITKIDCDDPANDSDVVAKSERVIEKASTHFSHAKCRYNFVNAPKLLSQASLRREKSKSIAWHSQPIEAPEGWVGLVRLSEYYKFIQDEHGDFNEEIVVENVRGFLQTTPVNDGIKSTLSTPRQNAEFWLLNNGITILAKDAQPKGYMQLAIVDPQIVNGLQSSRQIHKYFKSPESIKDDRRLLVRVIKVVNDEMRDQVIRATNSQNKMASEMLRATDPIHSKIEEVFGQYGLFYDRRKGYYKDQGKPVSQIVSMREVLQSILAVVLLKPNDARARPADYLKDDIRYDEVFKDNAFNLLIYYKAISIVRKIREYLLVSDEPNSADHLNIIFYVAMVLSCELTKNAYAPASGLLQIDVDAIPDKKIAECLAKVWDSYEVHRDHGAGDIVAKGSGLAKELKTRLHHRFPKTKKK